MNEELKKIIQEYSGEEVLSIRQISNRGQVNHVFVISTPSNKHVVRIDPSETTTDRFKKESWCMDQATAQGIPTSKALKVGLINRNPYMLLSYIEGINGEDKEDASKIWSKLGEYARKIHSIPVQGYGEKMTSDGFFDGSWEKFLDYNISSLSSEDQLLKRNIISVEQSSFLKNTFLELKKKSFKFGLVHNDLSLNNTMVGYDNAVYLLDWGSAEVNVIPHMDVAEILNSSLSEGSKEFESFLGGCELTKKQFHEIKRGIPGLMLLAYTDKIRWAIDKKPERINHFVKKLKSGLKELIG